MASFTREQLEQIKEVIKDTVIYSHQSKEKETSSLHREILNKITDMEENVKDMKVKVDNHDETIREVTVLLPDIKGAIETWKTTSNVGRILISVVVGVPALAAFVGGIIYLLNFFKQ